METRTVTQARGELPQEDETETLTVDGVTYRKRQNLTTILILGIDHTSDAEESSYYEGGQADFQRLIVLDADTQTIRQLKIDRDTITDVTMLGLLGSPIGTKKMQISLAHGFGDGKEQSCELAVDAVSNLLDASSIDFYMALDLDGIPVLNDLVGGVTVTLEDDFSSIDPAMTPGTTLTLHGSQAETFVRSRINIGEGTNEARMVRQETYLHQLALQLNQQLQADKQFSATVLDTLSPYLTTNLPRGRLINEAWAAKDYTQDPIVEISGEHKVADDGFMEFYPDASSVQQAVLSLFWEPVS